MLFLTAYLIPISQIGGYTNGKHNGSRHSIWISFTYDVSIFVSYFLEAVIMKYKVKETFYCEVKGEEKEIKKGTVTSVPKRIVDDFRKRGILKQMLEPVTDSEGS